MSELASRRRIKPKAPRDITKLLFVGADPKLLKALKAERDRELARLGDLQSRCERFKSIHAVHTINHCFENAKELRQFAAFVFECAWDAAILWADRRKDADP